MCVVGIKRIIMRIYIFLVTGGVLCMDVYGANSPSMVVDFLLHMRRTIQPIRGGGPFVAS